MNEWTSASGKAETASAAATVASAASATATGADSGKHTDANAEADTQTEAAAPAKGLSKRAASFAWRGGKDRQTTGIWMWSEPFLRTVPVSSTQPNNEGAQGGATETETETETIAVLLMDTQGMFDNETSMNLTAQIFGLSTFVSSYQVLAIALAIAIAIVITIITSTDPVPPQLRRTTERMEAIF
jgi:atlastin